MVQRPVRVVVVGGGAAGVVTAATMLREAGGAPLDVRVVERSGDVGPGLAYGTQETLHLLNNYAVRMSAFDDDPAHLVRWCRAQGDIVGPDTFLPRRVYGAYLAALLDEPAPSASRLTRVRAEADAVDDSGSDYAVTLRSGEVLSADVVVLALGSPPPRHLPDVEAATRAYAANPWTPDLTDRATRGNRVLLVGTGLTTVDVAAQLANAHQDVEMVAVSRHGLLPRRHLDQPPMPAGVAGRLEPTVVDAIAAARHAVASRGGDWRGVVETVKAAANAQWTLWSYAEQQRFLRHAARHWEVSRHRMAPAMADIVEGLLLDGRLRIAHATDVDVASFDLVVNCTGPASAATPGWNPLVDGLAARGLLRAGPHGLGLDVSADGRLLDATGVPARAIHVVGAARRGVEWEVAAVPDIRRQARSLAQRLRPVSSSAALVG